MKIINLLLLMILGLLVACSQTPLARDVEEFYQGSGVEKYFVSNIDQIEKAKNTNACQRVEDFRYFEVNKLVEDYKINFQQSLQVQAQFNLEYLAVKEEIKMPLPRKDEEAMFYRALDRTRNEIYFFYAPEFKRIHLIWFDEVMGSEAKIKKLKNFLNSSVHDNGVPVVVSSCMTKKMLETYLGQTINKAITLGMFSLYDSDLKNHQQLVLDLRALFKENQKLILYTQDKKTKNEQIIGKVEVKSY